MGCNLFNVALQQVYIGEDGVVDALQNLVWGIGFCCCHLVGVVDESVTQEAVNPESSYYAGKTFGEFEAQLTDITDRLGETIPDFHNMELRRDQLRQAVKEDKAGRAEGVKDFIADIEKYMDEMCSQ